MAIFNKSDGKSANNKSTSTTVIANGTTIKGDISIECNLHIDGNFEGNITSEKNVTIGKTGIVVGDIVSQRLMISGEFKGNIDANLVDVMPDGKLYGKVKATEFVIERGGFFEGESKTKENLKLENKKPLIIESKKDK